MPTDKSLPDPVRPVVLMLVPMALELNSLRPLLDVIIVVVRVPVASTAVPVPVPIFPVAVVVALPPLVDVLVVSLAAVMPVTPAAVVVVRLFRLVLGLLLAALVLEPPPLCRSGESAWCRTLAGNVVSGQKRR